MIYLVYMAFFKTRKKEQDLKDLYKSALLIIRDYYADKEKYEYAQEIHEIIKKISKE